MFHIPMTPRLILHAFLYRASAASAALSGVKRSFSTVVDPNRRGYRAYLISNTGNGSRGRPFGTASGRNGRKRRGSRSTQPPASSSSSSSSPTSSSWEQNEDQKKKKQKEDIILYEEEDEEGLAEFMEEYDALLEEEEQAATSSMTQPLIIEELEIEETDDGQVKTITKSRHSPAQDDAVSSLLKQAKEAGAMSEDDWFEFLRRTGMQREASTIPMMDDDEDDDEEGEIISQKGPKPRKRNAKKRPSKRKFIDRICIAVSGGRGGKGCISFEVMGPGSKRPSGGHGGQGGDVIFVADPRVQSLDFDRHHFHGKDGTSGDSNNKRGARGQHTVVRVPCGTVVKQVRRVLNEEGLKRYKRVEVFDLDEPMSHYKAASGGKPGLGNSIQAGRSRKSASDHFRSPGSPGEQRYYELELKTIADVGLVGYPNAGKSTLLGSLSRAKPKVASYAFTTLHPMVGIVEFTDAITVTVADLPGLIEGAHVNKGLGHEFLRHIERTKVLLYVLDGIGPYVLPTSDASPVAGLADEPAELVLGKLQEELELYSSGLSKRPSIIWINKADLSPEIARQAKQAVEAMVDSDTPVFLGSAMKGDNIGQLATYLRRIIHHHHDGTPFPTAASSSRRKKEKRRYEIGIEETT